MTPRQRACRARKPLEPVILEKPDGAAAARVCDEPDSYGRDQSHPASAAVCGRGARPIFSPHATS